jgi:hypothetical protein
MLESFEMGRSIMICSDVVIGIVTFPENEYIGCVSFLVSLLLVCGTFSKVGWAIMIFGVIVNTTTKANNPNNNK